MGANIEITEDGIKSPDTGEIKTAIQDVFLSAFGSSLSLDDATPQGVLIDGLTLMKQSSNIALMYLMNQINPETADGVFQEALAKIYFVNRKLAQPSVVTCRCYGVNGTEIRDKASGNPAMVISTNGDIFQCASGGIIGTFYDDETEQWETDGYIDLPFESIETGKIPCGANTVNSIYKTVSGWDSVNNIASGDEGQEEEGRIDFKKRIADSVATGSTGSLSSIQSALASLNGVNDYKLYENVTSSPITVRGVTIKAHSVWICVYGSVSGADIAKVIYEKKSAGCDTTGTTHCSYTDNLIGITYDYTYDLAQTSDVYVKVTIDSSVSQSVINSIKQAIVDDFNGDGESNKIRIGESVYANRFCRPVDDLGVNIVTMKVSKDGSNYSDYLTFDMNELPVLSLDNVTVVVSNGQ